MAVALVAGTWSLLAKGSTGSEIATVVALPVAILTLLVAVFTIGRAARSSQTDEQTLAGAARRLAGKVGLQEDAASVGGGVNTTITINTGTASRSDGSDAPAVRRAIASEHLRRAVATHWKENPDRTSADDGHTITRK